VIGFVELRSKNSYVNDDVVVHIESLCIDGYLLFFFFSLSFIDVVRLRLTLDEISMK